MHITHFLDVDRAAVLTIPRRHAVVIGGSLAGMMAARVLSDLFDSVTLVERDRLPETPANRNGLPQSRHVHALLERGRGAMERFFPGLTRELVQAGADLLNATRDIAWLGPYGWYVRFPGDLQMLASSRDLIDWAIRGRLSARSNVRIRQEADVAGLIRGPGDGDGPRIAGVRLRSRTGDRSEEDLTADLVVVADGRNSRLPQWLVELGYEPPEVTVVNSFQGYASRLYRPPATSAPDWKALYVQQAPPGDPRGGLIFPVEGNRWLVSLVGGDADYPPTDEAGFLEFARGLRSPAVYEAIAQAEPLGPIIGQRGTENRLRHYDRLERFPDGIVAVGDAVCAFNPVYGQGMTAAAIGAEVLDRWLRDGSSHPSMGGSRVFQQRLARATATAWRLSTGADTRFRTMVGPSQGRAARLTGRYIDWVMEAATRRPWMRQRLSEVLHLLRPLSALFGPGVLTRLAWDQLVNGSGATPRQGTVTTHIARRTVPTGSSHLTALPEYEARAPERTGSR